MSTISVGQFLTATVNWARANGDRFKYYWPVKGGWEGWIQVDLTAYLLAINSTLEILREQAIFINSRQRVDLLLNTDQMTGEQIAVEIKAESFLNRMDPFVLGTRDDLLKLSNDRIPDFSKSTCAMLALPFNQQSYDAILGIKDNRDQKIFKSIYVGNEIAICASVCDEAEGWHQPTQIGAFEGNLARDTAVAAQGFR